VPNPWLKKNPFISMWLSGANPMANSARGQIGAEVKRQSTAAADKHFRHVCHLDESADSHVGHRAETQGLMQGLMQGRMHSLAAVEQVGGSE